MDGWLIRTRAGRSQKTDATRAALLGTFALKGAASITSGWSSWGSGEVASRFFPAVIRNRWRYLEHFVHSRYAGGDFERTGDPQRFHAVAVRLLAYQRGIGFSRDER